MKKEQYIKKWLAGKLSEEEMREFEQMESYRELKRISDSVLQFKATAYDTESELHRFNQQKYRKPQGNGVSFNWQKTLLRVAATLTIVIGSYIYYMYFLPVTIETGVAEKREIIFPDSSMVILNSVSSIKFRRGAWKWNRKVELVGEAFFKVRSGSTFEVKTRDVLVRVLGTQFNVKQRVEYFEVICYEGRVQVKTDNEVSELQASHSLQNVKGMIERSMISNESMPSWLMDESSFRSVPFGEVIREFERQYKVAIVVKNIDTETLFSGRFTHNDMILALKSITVPQNITFQVTGNQQVILKGVIE